jgi:hypothetical protein
MEGKEFTCACKKCVAACESRPCWGTPEEIQAIIVAGHGDRLWNDWWVGGGTEGNDIQILSPASVGQEGGRAPDFPGGENKCAFLTENNKCELHEPGLKPYEGRVAGCKMDPEHNAHRETAMTWNNPQAQNLVHKWRDERRL